MADSLADFLTFVSPICILVLFFMCFFRFLFKSCECGASTEDEESCQSSRPSSTPPSRVHPCHRHANEPETIDFYGEIIVCPAHCEGTFPPKYEDALKMTVCSGRNGSIASTNNNDSRRSSDLRATLASPPPVYNDAVTPIEEDSPSSSSDAPPAYTTSTNGTIPSFFLRVQQAFTRRSFNRPATPSDSECIDVENLKPHGRPTTAASIATLSTQVVNPVPMPEVSSAPRRLSVMSTSTHASVQRSPPRPTLPGAIEVDEDEETDANVNQDPHAV